MPILETQEYEQFSYDEQPLTLDEAIKKARDLRRTDPANFYRVKHGNEGRTMFTVKKIPASSVYADFVAKMAKLTGRFSIRTARR